MRNIAQQYQWYALVGAVCAALGLLLGILLPVQSPIENSPDQYETGTTYKFINPLLECGDDNFSRIENGQTVKMQNDVNSYLAQEEQNGTLDTASVYFRELNGGQFFAINPTIQFVPASLLKVPLAMSVYLQAEQNPQLLSQKVFFASSEAAPAREFFTAPTIAASSTYTVTQLVDAMLEDSDNNAALLLTHVINTADLDQSYSDLGVIVPQDQQYTMTVQTYAGFFRVLYNATYLNHDDSEHLLSLLARSTFTQGIVAGVPPGITVAHKFGERGYNNPEPDQLHDCGIVYAKQPYLLCVMTQGHDYTAMAAVIAQISKLIYGYAGS